MKKLTIEQLRNYLGTGLKFKTSGYTTEFVFHGITSSGTELYCKILGLTERSGLGALGFQNQPLMHRLSDLDKFIPELGFVPLIELYKDIEPDSRRIQKGVSLMNWPMIMPFHIIQKLFQWHFWVFDQSYFDEGLIIDKLKQV